MNSEFKDSLPVEIVKVVGAIVNVVVWVLEVFVVLGVEVGFSVALERKTISSWSYTKFKRPENNCNPFSDCTYLLDCRHSFENRQLCQPEHLLNTSKLDVHLRILVGLVIDELNQDPCRNHCNNFHPHLQHWYTMPILSERSKPISDRILKLFKILFRITWLIQWFHYYISYYELCFI